MPRPGCAPAGLPAQGRRRRASATASSVSPPAQSAISPCTTRTSSSGPCAGRALAHQLGEPLVAVHLAGAAGLDQPVRVGEEQLAVLERQLATPRTAACTATPSGRSRALRRVTSLTRDDQGREVPGVGVAQRALGEHSQERRHEAVLRQPPLEHRVGLGEHRRRGALVPAAGLDEEADHGAQRRGLHALAGHVADQQGHLAAREPPDAVEVAARGLPGRRRVEEPRLVAGQLRAATRARSRASARVRCAARARSRSRWRSRRRRSGPAARAARGPPARSDPGPRAPRTARRRGAARARAERA